MPKPKRVSVPIQHIGYFALCNAKHHADNVHRIDLGSQRYKQLGVRERFKNEKPYRICKRCIAVIVSQENAWKKLSA